MNQVKLKGNVKEIKKSYHEGFKSHFYEFKIIEPIKKNIRIIRFNDVQDDKYISKIKVGQTVEVRGVLVHDGMENDAFNVNWKYIKQTNNLKMNEGIKISSISSFEKVFKEVIKKNMQDLNLTEEIMDKVMKITSFKNILPRVVNKRASLDIKKDKKSVQLNELKSKVSQKTPSNSTNKKSLKM